MTLFLVVGLAVSVAGPSDAAVYSPRVASPHRADSYSMAAFAQYPRWRDLEGDALAWEVYRYLADAETGLFHMNEVLEGDDVLSEYNTVRDPVKIIGVYGYGYCGILGPVMAGVAEGIGLGPSRTVVLPDWHHVVAEAHYGGKWHYLDLDVRAAFRRADGTLASLAEAKADPSLWVGPQSPLFFPNDPLDKTREVYERTATQHYYAYHRLGHTMDFVLRQGETLTRWWEPRGGRWHHPPAYNDVEWLMKLIEQPPRGPKPNHRHFTVHNYANGRFVYAPVLTSASTDFADGVYGFANVTTSSDGLTLVAPGEGYAVFEVRSPYIIVPVVGDTSTTDDDREASVVELDGTGLSVLISLDNGLTWVPIDHPSLQQPLDLTPHVAGTYGYLLKLALKGDPGAALVRSLRITTWVQVAPAALPALGPGSNHMELRTGDDRQLNTRVMELRTEAATPEGLLKYLDAAPEDFDPARQTSRIRRPVTVRVAAPPRTKIAWLSVTASFQTYQLQDAARTKNEMAYAVGQPTDFETIYGAEVPTDQEHWHYNVNREITLDRPVATVSIRLVGDPGLNNVCVRAHLLDDEPRPASPVVVTHVWREGEQRREQRLTLDQPGEYEVTVDGDPIDESIEIAVPSDGPPPPAPAETAEARPGSEGADWIAPMRQVHARFTGEAGTFAQFGDSITESRAFWTGLQWTRNNAPPEMVQAYELVSGYMLPECWDGKGADKGNLGGMTIRWAHDNVGAWLRDLNPEVAVVMFGTNDLNSVPREEYEAKLRGVVQQCLDSGTVVILSTIPPRHGFEERSAEFATTIRAVAADLHVPLTDFHAETMGRRPDDWDGALDKFAEFDGYDVPTLIARDGVHPSHPQQHQGDYSVEALNNCGFSLRNYMVLTKYAEVIRKVLAD